MKNFKRIILFIIALITVGCIDLQQYFDPLEYSKNRPHNPLDDPPSDFQYYKIKPKTILSDIKNNENKVFSLLDTEPDVFEEFYQPGKFPWLIEDYFDIAKAHLIFLTNETMEDGWYIYGYGSFGIYQCSDNLQGFDSANIIFYKKNADKSFSVIYMYIYPLEELIYSSYLSYEPRANDDGFQEAKVIHGNINSVEALKIVEQKFGVSLRKELLNNDCSIWITFFNDPSWHIDYSWDATDLKYKIGYKVDATDGSYKIVYKRVLKCERSICP